MKRIKMAIAVAVALADQRFEYCIKETKQERKKEE